MMGSDSCSTGIPVCVQFVTHVAHPRRGLSFISCVRRLAWSAKAFGVAWWAFSALHKIERRRISSDLCAPSAGKLHMRSGLTTMASVSTYTCVRVTDRPTNTAAPLAALKLAMQPADRAHVYKVVLFFLTRQRRPCTGHTAAGPHCAEHATEASR